MSLSQDFDLIRYLAEGGVGWQVVELECEYRGYGRDVWSLIKAVVNCDTAPNDREQAGIMRCTAVRQYKSGFWHGLARWKQSQYETDELPKQHYWDNLQIHMRTANFRDQADKSYLLRQIEAAALDCPETVTETTWYARAKVIEQMAEAGDYDTPKRVLQLLKVPLERPDLKQLGNDLVREVFNRVGQPGMMYSPRQMVELTINQKNT